MNTSHLARLTWTSSCHALGCFPSFSGRVTAFFVCHATEQRSSVLDLMFNYVCVCVCVCVCVYVCVCWGGGFHLGQTDFLYVCHGDVPIFIFSVLQWVLAECTDAQ